MGVCKEMKKLITALILLCSGCVSEHNLSNPFIITNVEATGFSTKGVKYLIHFDNNGWMDFYTDSLYKVGDTLEMKTNHER